MGEGDGSVSVQKREPDREHGSDRESQSVEHTEETATEITNEQIYDVLRNRKRRIVISYLLGNGGEGTLDDLIAQIAIEEYDVGSDQLTSDERKRVYTGLYQCHLPRMDKFGIIEFDTETNTVTLGDNASSIEPYLGRNDSSGIARLRLAVALVVTPLVVLGLLGVGPLDVVPLGVLAGLTVCALLGLALLSVYKIPS